MRWVAALWGECETRQARPHSPLCPTPGSWRRRGNFHAPRPGRVRSASPGPESGGLGALGAPFPAPRPARTPKSPAAAGAGRARQGARVPTQADSGHWARGGRAASGPAEQSPHGHLETVNRPPGRPPRLPPAAATSQRLCLPSSKSMAEARSSQARRRWVELWPAANTRDPRFHTTRPRDRTRRYRPGSRRPQRG